MNIIIVVKRWGIWGISMIDFIVKDLDSSVQYSIHLERRLTILKGDSGIGKTSMIKLLRQTGKFDAYISEDMNYVVNENLDVFEAAVRNMNNRLFIFDDIDILSMGWLKDIYKNAIIPNNNFMLVIHRETILNMPKRMRQIPFSSNSILTLSYTGEGLYETVPYHYAEGGVFSACPDIIIVEDSKAGFQFYKELFRGYEVISSYGKSNMVAKIQECNSKGYRNIYAIFDTASYGAYMEQLSAVCSKKSMCNVTYMSDYECFEELLCHTNLVSPYIDWDSLEPNNVLSWERYFEKLLRRITNDKKFLQAHESNLNPCYRVDCNNMDRCRECDTFLSGDKLEALLRGTKYERLLRYRKE